MGPEKAAYSCSPAFTVFSITILIADLSVPSYPRTKTGGCARRLACARKRKYHDRSQGSTAKQIPSVQRCPAPRAAAATLGSVPLSVASAREASQLDTSTTPLAGLVVSLPFARDRSDAAGRCKDTQQKCRSTRHRGTD